ncbi:MAG: ATP-binding cassette domain-containing protein, partial [Bacteroidetes bacterium]|nr:ATP-binding cassette domain-containing protein [Bacteroidota bacterium]
MSLLKLQNINTGYGKKQVLFDINLELTAGETVLLIGSNGSGKSTLLKTIYRLLPLWNANNGEIGIKYDNLNITNKNPFELIGQGMVYI